ncbi:MAG: hypothetical protein ACO3A4_07680 [Silvanigrellaceae bacterium]
MHSAVRHIRTIQFTARFAATGLVLLPLLSSCKPRAFNDSQVQSGKHTTALTKTAEALAESLMPVWPVPQNSVDLRSLPMVTSLGISTASWQSYLNSAFTDVDQAGAQSELTLSNPECARSVDSWRVSAARLSIYELDLPGNVTAWQTLALQRETDLAQRVQLHVTVQPWCTSPRLDRSDFVHTLDHAFLFTFDITLPQLSKGSRSWLDDLSSVSNQNVSVVIPAERAILPYASALMEIHDYRLGRTAIVRAWNQALKFDELVGNKSLPSNAWVAARQRIALQQGVGTLVDDQGLAHPTLKTSPGALNAFFSRFVSEKNLLRVRAHVTEGLGTTQRFLRWERKGEKLLPWPMQTIAAQWDRNKNAMTLSPLLTAPTRTSRIGSEQPVQDHLRAQLKDIDVEATPLAEEMSIQDLLLLGERTIEPERTSVHTTRCVSCHGMNDALSFAREGRPPTQRGIRPMHLSMFGVSMDAKPVVNFRTIRSAESDASRFEEEQANAKQPAARP